MRDRRQRRWTFDPIQGIAMLLAAGLIVGVVPFTNVWVGATLFVSLIEMKFEMGRRR